MLCRNDTDCTWLDDELQCQKYTLDFQPDTDWFDGHSKDIVGQCQCGDDMDWQEEELECYVPSLGGGNIALIVVLSLAGAAVMGGIVYKLVC